MTADQLPNDESVIPELAFPSGLRVFKGPRPGLFGVVDWSSDGPLPGSQFCPASTMRQTYYPAVPVRLHGLFGRIIWVHPRWLLPIG